MTYLDAGTKRNLETCTPFYKEAETLTGVPWRLLGAIHYRENTCMPSANRPGGAMQKDPPWAAAKVAQCAKELNTALKNPESDLRTSIIMAAWFIQKEKARPALTASSPRAAQLDAAYRYNGTGYGDINKSPYVFNDPKRGRQLYIRGTLLNPDGTRLAVNTPDARGGVNAVLDEIGGMSELGSGTPTTAPPVCYYPVADWPSCRLEPGTQFLSPAYRSARKAEHPGQDVNKGNGAYADLGEPVYSIADGVVVHVGKHETWGNLVLIHHPQYGVWSNYAHVRDVYVVPGQVVAGASKIATIGAGDPVAKFTPHLHFEIRVKDIPATKWPGLDRAYITAHYVDPIAWLRSHGARNINSQDGDLHPTLVRARGDMIAFLRERRPELRLQTTRTYDPPLIPRLGPAGAAKGGPHSVRPALAFDFVIVRGGASTGTLSPLDPLYAELGAYAERRGVRWGPNAPATPGERGSRRDHIELKNATAALEDAQERAKAGLIPSGSVDVNLAGQGSDPVSEMNNRRNPCPRR